MNLVKEKQGGLVPTGLKRLVGIYLFMHPENKFQLIVVLTGEITWAEVITPRSGYRSTEMIGSSFKENQ